MDTKQKMIVYGELTDLNTYINAERRNRFLGAKIKKENTENVVLQSKNFTKITQYPINIEMHFYTKNERKDPDNVAFCKKFILDAFVQNKIIIDDSRKYINSFTDKFFVSDKPRIEIIIVINS
jgi:hypothetical protein